MTEALQATCETEQNSSYSADKGRPVACSEPSSFFSRFLYLILQLNSVKYLLEIIQKASVWAGFVVLVETIMCKVNPMQSPTSPGRITKKHRGTLMRLVLSIVPTRIQSFLGYLPVYWGQSSTPQEIREALINPFNKASKRKWDDVALEEQEAWSVVLATDPLETDPEDTTYEPSEVETDSEEYRSQNDTEADLELEEQDGILTLQESLDLWAEQKP